MATGEAAPAVGAGPPLPEDGCPNEAPKICVAARAPPDASAFTAPNTWVADRGCVAGLCATDGACAGAAGFAVKTEPQRVHWTGAPPGGISRSSSSYSVEHLTQEMRTSAVYSISSPPRASAQLRRSLENVELCGTHTRHRVHLFPRSKAA